MIDWITWKRVDGWLVDGQMWKLGSVINHWWILKLNMMKWLAHRRMSWQHYCVICGPVLLVKFNKAHSRELIECWSSLCLCFLQGMLDAWTLTAWLQQINEENSIFYYGYFDADSEQRARPWTVQVNIEEAIQTGSVLYGFCTPSGQGKKSCPLESWQVGDGR